MTSNFDQSLQRIIMNVSETRKSSLVIKSMCLLQLKRLLIDEIDDEQAVISRAGAAYASMRLTAIISREMRAQKSRREAARPSSAVQALAEDEDEDFLKMLDLSFRIDRGFTSMRPFHADDKKWTARLCSVNKYTELCVQLHEGGVENIKGTALKLYAFYASSIEKSQLLKDIAPLLTKRRKMLAFLYVAKRSDGWLFEYANSSSGIRELLNKQAGDVARLKKYFARCAYVQSVMARGRDISGPQIAQWAGVKPVRSSGLTGVPPSQLAEAMDRYEEREGR